MRHAPRLVALLIAGCAGGCAEIAQSMCHGQAQAAGAYLGTQYTGQSCTTSATYKHKGRTYGGAMSCAPTYASVYQWNTDSDRVYAICMAEVARRYPPRAEVTAAR